MLRMALFEVQEFDTYITILSVGLYLVLALMAWTDRRQDRVMLVFASFTLVMAAADLIGLWAQAAETVDAFAARMRFAMVANCLVPLGVLHHVLAISGRDERPEEEVLGVRASPVSLLVGFNLAALVVTVQVPGLLIDGYRVLPGGGFEPILSRPMLWVMGLEILGIGVICLAVMRRAMGRACATSRRSFLRLNLAGVLLILTATPLFGVVLPALGLQANVPLHLSLVAAAVVFYQAINRFQVERYQELNSNLEAEVEARTLDLHQAQARLVHAEAMAAVGRLAAGVTHEVNSPLAALLSASSTIRSAVRRVHGEMPSVSPQAAPPSMLARSLRAVQQSQEVLVRAGDRMQRVMANLQEFVGLDAAALSRVDLHACLDSTLELLALELGPGVEMRRHYGGDLPWITASRHELGQLFAHLLQNSAAAMGHQGRITLRTAHTGAEVQVIVEDSGPGIPWERHAGLFVPRLVRNGTRVKLGVGLATCQRIAREHCGDLTVGAAAGGGAAFTLTLPIDSARRAEEAA